MKKSIVILLLVCSLLLCGCGQPAAKTEGEVKYADQDAFLEDMAQGITKRLDDDRDSSKMNAEEKASYYLQLVGYELDRIEKYQDSSFEDTAFDELAHFYIESCQLQRFAAQNYKNNALHTALWDGGRKNRAAIITELYSRYGLPITSEQAASYSATDTTYSIVTSGSNASSTPAPDYSDCLVIKTLPVWNEHYLNADYYHYDLVVKNQSADCGLEVSIAATFYDAKGNVIGTDKETLYHLGKGEEQYCSLRTDVIFSRAEYKVTQAKEYTSYASGMKYLEFTVSNPSGKVVVGATNKGTETIEYVKVTCVFYNGKDIVDTEYTYIASHSDMLEPNETQYADLSTRKSFTSYELYYDSTLK